METISLLGALSVQDRFSFSTMIFLEYAIWGAWFVVLGQYLEAIKFSRKMIGRIYATMSLGAIISPMFVGTIADRYFAAEYLLSALHLVGAGLLCWMAYITTERKFYWVTFAYALVYTPTMALTDSIALGYGPDAAKDFPIIRVMGTIGWIAANLSLALFLKKDKPVNNSPLLIAAALSLVMGLFSLTLPHTPPKSADVALTWESIPFVKAVEMFKVPQLAVFLTVSFVVSIALAFYYSFTSLYLEKHVRVRPDRVGPLMTIGQWVEIGGMLILWWCIDQIGYRGVLIVGMAAWGVRYGIFAIGKPLPLIVFALALHGICFDFFLAAGKMFVSEQPEVKAIQHSAQSLLTVITYGIGMYLGTEASGWLNERLTRTQTDPRTGEAVRVTDWRTFWLIPAIGVVVCLVVFVALF